MHPSKRRRRRRTMTRRARAPDSGWGKGAGGAGGGGRGGRAMRSELRSVRQSYLLSLVCAESSGRKWLIGRRRRWIRYYFSVG